MTRFLLWCVEHLVEILVTLLVISLALDLVALMGVPW